MQKALPNLELSQRHCGWLQGARSRVLRSARIHRSKHILDLGCGWGLTTVELAERCQALVTGIDVYQPAIEFASDNVPPALSHRVAYRQCCATNITFLESKSIDLIFTQCSLMWIPDLGKVFRECRRLLEPGGRLVLIEPDYGGLMEWPPQIAAREIWLEVLALSGADPLLGRRLPPLLADHGFQVNSYLLDRYEEASGEHLGFLDEIATSAIHRNRLMQIRVELETLGPKQAIAHLPYWLVMATKRV